VAWILTLALAAPARAQEPPLHTADPVPLPHGTIAIELGADFLTDFEFPLSGLSGDLVRAPSVGLRLGLGGIGEFQVTTGWNHLFIESRGPGPFADQVEVDGDVSQDVDDPVVATKIRLHEETARWPATGIRAATRLPSAGQESGLGNDAMDFLLWILVGKTVGTTRLLVNGGLGILSAPLRGDRQNDVLVYGVSASHPLDDRWTLAAEIHGRRDLKGDTPPGTEDHDLARLGARWTRAPLVLHGTIVAGLNDHDPDIGAAVGISWTRQAYR
jgi:hypothetical protein